MSTPLHTKIKLGLLKFVETRALGALSGYSYVRGIRAGLLTMPCVAFAVTKREPAFDENESPVWKCTAEVCIRTRADFTTAHASSTAEDAHEAAVDAIEAAMTHDAVRAFVNAENTTNRPITSFHLSEFSRPSVESHYDAPGTAFLTVLTFDDLMVMASDGDA